MSYFVGSIYIASDGPEPTAKVAVQNKVETIITGSAFPEELHLALKTDYRDENKKRARIKNELCQAETREVICGKIDKSKSNVLLIGDSFGRDGINSLAIGYPTANLIIDVIGGCPLVPDVNLVTHANKACKDLNNLRFEEIERILPEIDTVILSIKITQERVVPVQGTIAWLRDKNARVIVLGNPPMFRGRRLPDIIQAHGKVEGLNEFASEWMGDLEPIDAEMERYTASVGAAYIRRRDHLCPEIPNCDVLIDGKFPITMDNAHQSYAAAEAFGKYLAREYPDLLEPT
ncbi:MAG: SGNH hydrolase domain-containing protein [Henriciella sp.]